MKQYLIDKDTLKDLLTAAHYYAILERDGVDNWEWYMEGRKEYLLEGIREMPWHQGKSWEDLEQYIEEEGYMVSDLVNDEIEAFWEEHQPSGEWIKKERIINEYGDTETSFICPYCDKEYKRGEYTPKRFIEEHKFCPNCGTKINNEIEETV